MSGRLDRGGEALSGEWLPASAEAEWGRFARHLELMGDETGSLGWLVFVFAHSPAVADVVRERVKAQLEGGSGQERPFVELPAETPARLQNVLPRLLGGETQRAGCAWIQAVVEAGKEDEQARWREAWEQLLLGMNERRDAIRRNVSGGLVLAGPLWMKEMVQAAAPDLWSVRTLVLELPEEGPDRDAVSSGRGDLAPTGTSPGIAGGVTPGLAGGVTPGLAGGVTVEISSRDFVAEVERVLRLREPEAVIERRPAPWPLAALLISRRGSGRVVDVGVVGVLDGPGVEEEMMEGVLVFQREIQETLRRESPLLRCTLVHRWGVAADATFEEARRGGVVVVPFEEYQSVVDFSRYLEWQSGRLERDPVYPPDLYVEQRAEVRVGVDRTTTEDVLFELHAALRKPVPRFFLVLGDFGTGKTFLLRQLTRRMAADPESPAPVLIEMRDLQKSLSLDMLLAQHFVRQPEGRIPVDAFRYMLSEGKAALLFDGFDELAFRLSYDAVREHFETLVQAAEGKAKIVVTSRTAHFLNDGDIELALGREAKKISGYTLLKVAPFDPPRIHKALVKRLGGEEQAAERERLLARVEDLMGLSSNPRMLAFILDSFTADELREVGESHAKLTRSGVYERLVTRWLRGEVERATPKGAEAPLSEAQLWKAVTDFALLLWPITDKGLRMRDLPEALWAGLQALDPARSQDTEAMKVSVGSRSLLVRDDEGRFSFLHQSILEWLVARDAAQELTESGTAVMLKRRAMSPLMADFFLEMGGTEKAAAWARANLSAGGEASKNAALLLQKLGPAGADPADVIEVQIDLSGQDLRGQDFSGSDYLRGADLTNARLDGATLVGADLSEAILAGATLRRVDARQASFRGADLTAADLTRADLRKADLSDARLERSDLGWTRMLGARVSPEALRAAALFGAAGPHEERATAKVLGHLVAGTGGLSFSVEGDFLLVFSGHSVRDEVVSCWRLPACSWEGFSEFQRNGAWIVTSTGVVARAPQTVARAADGSLVFSVQSRGLEIWEFRGVDGAHLLRRRIEGYEHVAAHPSKPLVAVVSTGNLLHVWDTSRLLGDLANVPVLASLVATRRASWVAVAPDGRYKVHGDVRGFFWHDVNGVRFEAGELDDDLDAFDIPPRRVPLDEPLFEMPE